MILAVSGSSAAVATMSARGRVNPGQRTLQRTAVQGCLVPIADLHFTAEALRRAQRFSTSVYSNAMTARTTLLDFKLNASVGPRRSAYS